MYLQKTVLTIFDNNEYIKFYGSWTGTQIHTCNYWPYTFKKSFNKKQDISQYNFTLCSYLYPTLVLSNKLNLI